MTYRGSGTACQSKLECGVFFEVHGHYVSVSIERQPIERQRTFECMQIRA